MPQLRLYRRKPAVGGFELLFKVAIDFLQCPNAESESCQDSFMREPLPMSQILARGNLRGIAALHDLVPDGPSMPESLVSELGLPHISEPVAVKVPEITAGPYRLPRSSGQGGRKLFVVHRRGSIFDLGIEVNGEFRVTFLRTSRYWLRYYERPVRRNDMKARMVAIAVVFGASVAIPTGSLAQRTSPEGARHDGMLSVNGHPGTTPLVQMNGRSYVDLAALTRMIGGSLAYKQDHVVLTLPASTVEASAAEAKEGFSKPFVKAGIEQMAVTREWRIGIVNAVQGNYPISEEWVSAQKRLAERNLRLASAAASTDDDRSGVPLLTAEFKNMEKLSDRILAKRRQASYIPPKSLNNDPLDQQILACAKSMATMLENNAFHDDANCREARN